MIISYYKAKRRLGIDVFLQKMLEADNVFQ